MPHAHYLSAWQAQPQTAQGLQVWGTPQGSFTADSQKSFAPETKTSFFNKNMVFVNSKRLKIDQAWGAVSACCYPACLPSTFPINGSSHPALPCKVFYLFTSKYISYSKDSLPLWHLFWHEEEEFFKSALKSSPYWYFSMKISCNLDYFQHNFRIRSLSGLKTNLKMKSVIRNRWQLLSLRPQLHTEINQATVENEVSLTNFSKLLSRLAY